MYPRPVTIPAFVQWLVAMEHFVVSPELAGQKGVLLGEDAGVRIEADFPTPPDGYAWVSVGTDETPELIGIRNLWLRAHLTTSVGTHPVLTEERTPTPDEMADAQDLYQLATTVAERVLAAFLDIAAQRHKRFLARIATPLSDLHAKLYVGELSQQVKAGRAINLQAIVHGLDRPTLTPTEAASIAAAITAGELPNLGWQLYARAHRLLQLESNQRQCVLEAAIAVEVSLDSAYLRVGKPQSLVELIIDRLPLDVQLKQGAAAVLGRSFAEHDAASYQSITRLLKERNAIVHQGKQVHVTDAELRRQLAAVSVLLTWLDSL